MIKQSNRDGRKPQNEIIVALISKSKAPFELHFLVTLPYLHDARKIFPNEKIDRLCNRGNEPMATGLRIQGHFFVRETTTGERKKSVLMTCHFPHLGNAFDWLKQISHGRKALPRSGLCHVVGKELRVISG